MKIINIALFTAFAMFSCRTIDTKKHDETQQKEISSDPGIKNNEHVSFDSLHTEEEILNFLASKDEFYKKNVKLSTFSTSECNSFDKENLLKLEEKFNIKSFYKRDLDSDGRIDLLLNIENMNSYVSNHDCTIRPMVIFNVAPDSIRITSPINEGINNSIAFYNETEKAIGIINNSKVSQVYAHKGLLFSKPSNNIKHTINSIEFSSGSCFGTCPVFELMLNRNGSSKFIAKQFNFEKDINLRTYQDTNEREREYETAITSENWKEIEGILNYANFLDLKENYGNYNITDMPSYQITINYDNNLKKTIDDYGHMSDTTVNSLIDYLSILRWTLNWEKNN